MKKFEPRTTIAIALLALAVVAVFVYTRLTPPTLVGAWSNQAPTDRIGFTFRDDGTGVMTIGNARLDYRYRLDRTHRPAWLDLDAAPNGAPVTIKAIVEFVPGGKLKIRLPFTRTPGARPEAFVENDIENTILLTRLDSPP